MISKVRVRLIAGMLILATVISFGSVIKHDFVYFDDDQTIGDNSSLNPPTLDSILAYWNPHNDYMALYIPVTYTVWGACAKLGYVSAMDEHGWYLNPYVFHAASLLIHLLNVLLVFGLLLRLTGQSWAAGFAAMLFALHPLQVETVAWASGLKDLLCTLFILLTLSQYIAFADPASKSSKFARLAHFFLAVLFTALGILSKPTAMVAPLMCGVIGYFLLQLPLRKTILTVLIPLALLSPLILHAHAVQPASPVVAGPVYLRPVVASFTLGFYLFKLIWPAQLAMDYSWYPQRILATNIAYVTIILPILLLGAMLWARKRIPWITAAIFLMIIGILPVLGLSPFQYQYHSTVADHYFYPSMFGVALAVSFLLRQFPGKFAFIAAAAVLLALGVRSFLQMPNFADNSTFFEHALAVDPRSVFARVNYSRYFIESAKLEEASPDSSPARVAAFYDAAETQLKNAMAVRPDATKAYEIDANLLIIRKRFDEANAMAEKNLQLMRSQPDQFQPADVAGNEVGFAGRFLNAGQYARAEKFAAEAIADQGDNADAHQVRTLALIHLHRLSEIATEADAAAALAQRDPGAHASPAELRMLFASQLLKENELDAAEAQLRCALQLHPPNSQAIQQFLQSIDAQRTPTTQP